MVPAVLVPVLVICAEAAQAIAVRILLPTSEAPATAILVELILAMEILPTLFLFTILWIIQVRPAKHNLPQTRKHVSVRLLQQAEQV